MKQFLLDAAKRVLPDQFVHWYRRRRVTRRYLRTLGHELYQRNTRLDTEGDRIELEDLEGRIAARKQGFYDGLVRDVLERTEILLQELDRRIEGVNARHENALKDLRREVESLRARVEQLSSAGGEPSQGPPNMAASADAPADQPAIPATER